MRRSAWLAALLVLLASTLLVGGPVAADADGRQRTARILDAC
jgi:hypothetical protein